MKKFNPLNVSSKFAICGLPIRVDSYKTCEFGCTYCFSNCRKIMEFSKELQIADVQSVERRLDRVLCKCEYDSENYLDSLIAQGITWHMGGMSDPFQPCEAEHHCTRDIIDLTNKYGVSVLISTKAADTYGADLNPELHSIQLSVTNVDDRRDLEPNVPPIFERLEFFRQLKRDGFRVGIRIQPFIPGVTNLDVVKIFDGADQFTLEGLKLVPQNKEHKEYLMNLLDLSSDDFVQMGLLNLRPEIRAKMYEPFIEFFQDHRIPYSIADNDLHHVGTNSCCCGDRLVKKSTTYSNTAMCSKYGPDYCLDDVMAELNTCGDSCCKCNQLFTSNRQEGCRSVEEFYEKRFDRKSSPFSPHFLNREVIPDEYREAEQLDIVSADLLEQNREMMNKGKKKHQKSST